MADREKIIGLLSEIAEYFRECRSNVSFASKAENHFWELQNAAGEAAALLKEQKEIKEQFIEAFNTIRDAYNVPANREKILLNYLARNACCCEQKTID